MIQYGGLVIGGIVTVALVYVLLMHSSNLQKEAGGAVTAYTKITKTFQGN